MANFTRSRSHGRLRRQTSWAEGPSQQPITLSAIGSTAWEFGTGTVEDGTTLIRTRGEFTLTVILVGAGGDGFDEAAVGIGVTTEEAFAVGGTTSLPSPLADLDWDGWLYHRLLAQFRGFSTTEVGRGPMEAVRIEIDSKAMRKFEDGMVVFGAVELGIETGTCQMEFGARTRLLVKLP